MWRGYKLYSQFTDSIIFAFSCLSFDASIRLPHQPFIPLLLVASLIIVKIPRLSKQTNSSKIDGAFVSLFKSALTHYL